MTNLSVDEMLDLSFFVPYWKKDCVDVNNGSGLLKTVYRGSATIDPCPVVVEVSCLVRMGAAVGYELNVQATNGIDNILLGVAERFSRGNKGRIENLYYWLERVYADGISQDKENAINEERGRTQIKTMVLGEVRKVLKDLVDVDGYLRADLGKDYERRKGRGYATYEKIEHEDFDDEDVDDVVN